MCRDLRAKLQSEFEGTWRCRRGTRLNVATANRVATEKTRKRRKRQVKICLASAVRLLRHTRLFPFSSSLPGGGVVTRAAKASEPRSWMNKNCKASYLLERSWRDLQDLRAVAPFSIRKLRFCHQWSKVCDYLEKSASIVFLFSSAQFLHFFKRPVLPLAQRNESANEKQISPMKST